MEKFIETPGFDVYRVYDKTKNLILKTGDRQEALEKGFALLLSDGKADIHHGPGSICDWDLSRNLNPEGDWHHDRIPLDFWFTLDDETREKLTK